MGLQSVLAEKIEMVQSRTNLDMMVIQEYAEAMSSGVHFPPISVLVDVDGKLWCWDGCHRTMAARQAGQAYIQADVSSGSRRDALLLAAGANSNHGLRRTNGDKRRAVQWLLDDPEWSRWSDREIASRCGVSHTFVAKMRPVTDNVSSERIYTTRHGTVSTMNVQKIGKSIGDIDAEIVERAGAIEQPEPDKNDLDITGEDFGIEDEPPSPAPRPAPVMTPAAPKPPLVIEDELPSPAPKPPLVMMPSSALAPAEVISIRILPGEVVAERRVMLAAGVEGRAPSVMRAGALRELPEMVRALVGEFINLAAADAVLAEMEIEEE